MESMKTDANCRAMLSKVFVYGLRKFSEGLNLHQDWLSAYRDLDVERSGQVEPQLEAVLLRAVYSLLCRGIGCPFTFVALLSG